MLVRRGLPDEAAVDSAEAVSEDSGVASSRGDDLIGDEEAEEPTSTDSTCVVNSLDMESNERVEPARLCNWRYLFTSILLLKYASRQSSKVTVFPSVGSGIATSRSLSLTNL